MAADADVQRTLLVLFAPEAHLGAPYARRILSGAGLVVVKEDKLSGEELEEAGIDVDDGGSGDQHQRTSHLAMVVEVANAVACARELRTGALATECPTLRTFAAPSLDAATMAIEILFPCLDEPKEETAAVATVTTSNAAPKPFALSNAAFEAKQEAAPAPAVERRLSPAIEKALAEVEAREEQQRLRKISRSSRGSGAASGTASPLASRDQSNNGTDVEATTFEQRVFTRARSPSPEPESLAGTDAERDVQDPEPTTQSPSPVPEQVDENLQRPIATPARSRASSALSHLSRASSTQSATTSNGFKARPAPPSSSKPAIQPRMAKAAALRLGIALPPATPRRSTINGPSPAAAAPAPTPQTSRATPRSLAQPTIMPRLTKAAALRLGQPDPSAATTPRVRQSISTAERAALDRARRQSALGTATSTTSTTTTTPRGAKVVEVRMSRAALLRQGLDASAPPSSSVNRTKGIITAGRASLGSSMPGPSTAAASGRPSTGTGLGPVSAELKALREPAIAPRMTKAASLRTGGGAGGAGAKGAAGRPSLLSSSSLANARATSASSSAAVGGSATTAAAGDRTYRPASATGGSLSSSASASRPASSASAGPRKSLSLSKGTTTTTSRTAAPPPPPPTLTPRLNKAAELRKAKLQETAAVAVGGNAAPALRGSTGTTAATPPSRKGKTLNERN
ncbi:hypothetical protein B0A53_04245 [Rhodotorula sp. CCFEE 5036]|nr:hypothetical protein B0A53_04245 [Rhodotorula sp. CCFEE 5036]